ncbi:Fig1p KNAG_0J00990 [Huiozyma naganishii CBS 8797]|uniref:Factor-induced gene 1 protein n=1 Tax=Huiozyma naganishii (strain ATCC MYA-139 / BCRC 22969 / CBS 8797 / KCTC 17520 / NBRC 10181 / NCYC 3082 / Yp74L-3) TaxID=1071383 RepID=J7SAH8_HUIN7|nr:hypothetical protein KNAG_0J00990 [Kazachstania naganishii CBS 8797]CCK72181.1 hypothetical protein KNAG_0J00990 [Kazachstania naganishii CBS 8797]
MGITFIWFLTKRIPKLLTLVFNIIVVFLTIFLLVGCYNTSMESTYLVRYEFNKDSSFYPVITNSFKGSNNTAGLESLKIISGYMGVCVKNVPSGYKISNQEVASVCYPRKNLTSVPLYSDVAVEVFNKNSAAGSTPSTLNILKLAELTSVNVIHPYILMATVILSIIQILTLVYLAIPHIPLKDVIVKFVLILSLVLDLIWGMGAIWTHIGIHASYRLVPAASMGIIKVHKGRKGAAMSWTAFVFLLLISIILWLHEWKKVREQLADAEPITNTSHKYYSSESSSFASKV